jgi:hypothetical protein
MILIIMTSYQGPKEEQGSLKLQNIKDIIRINTSTREFLMHQL